MFAYSSEKSASFGSAYICRATAFICSMVALVSCGLVDLRPVEVESEPCRAGTVLPSGDSPLTIRFSAEPDRIAAERAVSVSSVFGPAEGELRWEGATLIWKPVEPWSPRVRYRLSLNAVLPVSDGREAFAKLDVPFYALASTDPPALLSHWPLPGQSVGTGTVGDRALTLRFSEPMDEAAVRDHFSVCPSFLFDWSWNAMKDEVSLMLKESLKPCVAYSWKLGYKAAAADGAPIQIDRSGTFCSDADCQAPRVERTFPAVRVEDAWLKAGETLAELRNGQAIGIVFSEAMRTDNAAGIRIEPYAAGRLSFAGSELAVFNPDSGWEPERELCLVVPADMKDASGLALGIEYREYFMPDLDYLRLERVWSADDCCIMLPEDGTILPIALGGSPDGIARLVLTFSGPFCGATRSDALEAISLSPFFPEDLARPSLRSVAWTSDDTVVLEYCKLQAGNDAESHYYLLALQGGPAGLRDSEGSYLREALTIRLELLP